MQVITLPGNVIAAEWLIQLEELNLNIWECACGSGHLGKVFENHGYNVKATDLVNRGYGQGGVDFLACEEKFDGDIVTNPPISMLNLSLHMHYS